MSNSAGITPALLVTGANGFIGSALCTMLTTNGIKFRQAVRVLPHPPILKGDVAVVGNLSSQTDWSCALEKIDVVIHLAARVHVLNDTSGGSLDEFRRVNTEATQHLAKAAQRAGVKRFIYVSTIKVNGDISTHPFTESDKPVLTSPYAISKWEAEQRLLEMHQPSRFEIVIVRPPLVYGPGVGANFLNLIKLVDLGLPLPFGSIKNKRSMIAVDNLCHFLITCIDHPAAAGEVFLVSDGIDLSTTELVTIIAYHLNRRLFLLPIPYSSIKFLASMLKKHGTVSRLWGSLQIDTHKIESVLGWSPIVSVDEALGRTISRYRSQKVDSK